MIGFLVFCCFCLESDASYFGKYCSLQLMMAFVCQYFFITSYVFCTSCYTNSVSRAKKCLAPAGRGWPGPARTGYSWLGLAQASLGRPRPGNHCSLSRPRLAVAGLSWPKEAFLRLILAHTGLGQPRPVEASPLVVQSLSGIWTGVNGPDS